MKNGQLTGQDFYRSVIKESPVGYSYQKLIRDEEGNPVDYEFLEVNQAFEELTGLEGSEVIGRRGTEVLPGIRSGEVDWIQEYGEIAGTGKVKEFERFSEQLDRWYRVKVYSPEQDHFVTFFTDVTEEMKMVRASNYILQQPRGKIDYQELTDRALEIAGAKYAYFNLFEADGRSFTTKAVSGPREDVQYAASLLGLDLVGKTWDPDPDRWERMKGESVIHFDSITELTKGLLPGSIIRLLEKTFSVGETVLARIQKEDRMVGDFTLIMPKGKSLRKERLLEAYTKQVGSLIIRNRAEENLQESKMELKKSKERYQSYFEELGDAIFVLQMGDENHGKILEVNSSAERQTGYSREELIGMNLIEDLAVEQTAEIDYDTADQKLVRGEMVSFTEKKKRRDGTKYWTEVVVTPIEREGRQVNLSINRNITERVRAQENLNEERDKLRHLHDAVDELQRQNTEEEVIQTAVETAEKMLNFDLCAISLVEGDYLVPKANSAGISSDETASFKIGEGITGKTVERGETIWGDDLREYPEARPTNEEFKAFISTPIGKLGNLRIISRKVGSFDQQDVELVEILADHLREELKRVRLEEELRQQAIRDPLTGR